MVSFFCFYDICLKFLHWHFDFSVHHNAAQPKIAITECNPLTLRKIEQNFKLNLNFSVHT